MSKIEAIIIIFVAVILLLLSFQRDHIKNTPFACTIRRNIMDPYNPFKEFFLTFDEWTDREREFKGRYRLNVTAYRKLCRKMDPYLQEPEDGIIIKTPQKKKLPDGTDTTIQVPIPTAVAVHCLLRWIKGGQIFDIALFVGVSFDAFFPLIFRCMNIVETHHPDWSFPEIKWLVQKIRKVPRSVRDQPEEFDIETMFPEMENPSPHSFPVDPDFQLW